MERICGTEGLRALANDNWADMWSQKIIEQANKERRSNSRLNTFMETIQGTSLWEVIMKFLFIVWNKNADNQID